MELRLTPSSHQTLTENLPHLHHPTLPRQPMDMGIPVLFSPPLLLNAHMEYHLRPSLCTLHLVDMEFPLPPCRHQARPNLPWMDVFVQSVAIGAATNAGFASLMNTVLIDRYPSINVSFAV